MSDDLGVGLGYEMEPLFLQLMLQFEVVLDDHVLYHTDVSAAVAVRMGILFRRPAVGSPAGVADAVVPFEAVVFQQFYQVDQFPRGPADSDLPVGYHSDPGGVVAAVFQLAQSF